MSDFNGTGGFSTDFRKIDKMTDFIKIRPVDTVLLHADGRTNMTKMSFFFLIIIGTRLKGHVRTLDWTPLKSDV